MAGKQFPMTNKLPPPGRGGIPSAPLTLRGRKSLFNLRSLCSLRAGIHPPAKAGGVFCQLNKCQKINNFSNKAIILVFGKKTSFHEATASRTANIP